MPLLSESQFLYGKADFEKAWRQKCFKTLVIGRLLGYFHNLTDISCTTVTSESVVHTAQFSQVGPFIFYVV
jgi:hypothetical protein